MWNGPRGPEPGAVASRGTPVLTTEDRFRIAASNSCDELDRREIRHLPILSMVQDFSKGNKNTFLGYFLIVLSLGNSNCHLVTEEASRRPWISVRPGRVGVGRTAGGGEAAWRQQKVCGGRGPSGCPRPCEHQ